VTPSTVSAPPLFVLAFCVWEPSMRTADAPTMMWPNDRARSNGWSEHNRRSRISQVLPETSLLNSRDPPFSVVNHYAAVCRSKCCRPDADSPATSSEPPLASVVLSWTDAITMIHNNATMLIKMPHVINAQSMLSSILECFVFTHSKSKADACTPSSNLLSLPLQAIEEIE